jgi:hypothetical protein
LKKELEEKGDKKLVNRKERKGEEKKRRLKRTIPSSPLMGEEGGEEKRPEMIEKEWVNNE